MPLSSFKSGNSEINFRLEREQGAWLTSYHRTNSRKGVNFPQAGYGEQGVTTFLKKVFITATLSNALPQGINTRTMSSMTIVNL